MPEAVIRRRPHGRILGLLALAGLLWWPVGAEARDLAPEAATGVTHKNAVEGHKFMVVAANPLAAQAGFEVLKAGGSAADAAVAVQVMLGLVEPQSSGLGGGGLMLYWDAASRQLATIDGRDAAPAAATSELFLGPDGQPLKFYDAVLGGRSVGVPGALRLLSLVHELHGKLPWAQLFQSSIALAEEGFTVSPRLASLIAVDGGKLLRDPETRAYFLDGEGKPLAAGSTLRNPAFAKTLRQIAEAGPEAFYHGAIARDIAAKVQGVVDNPGSLSTSDIANYRAKLRPPACITYRVYQVCGMGPPSSGGLAVAQTLGILGQTDLGSLKPGSLEAAHLIAEASKLAFADRDLYVADPDFVSVPTRGMLDPSYLMLRAQALDRGKAQPVPVRAGNPPWRQALELAPDQSPELPSTSHFVIVDADGSVVSMTTSIEDAFGSRLMVDGFLLNNQLTDFSFRPQVDGRPVANRVEPGKRPRSSMAPTIVLGADGRPVLAVGSAGGARIIGHVVKTLVGVLDWKLDIQQAIDLPHVLNRNGKTELEQDTPAAALKPGLEALGHTVDLLEITSGLHGIQIFPDHLIGGADPRREGAAFGD